MIDPVPYITVEDVTELGKMMGRSVYSVGMLKDPESFLKRIKSDFEVQKQLLLDKDYDDLHKFVADSARQRSVFALWRLKIEK